MARVLCIDYGMKRCGIAVTDVLQIISTPLTTVATTDLLQFVQQYVANEKVETMVIGRPLQNNGKPSEIEPAIQTFLKQLEKINFHIPIVRYDERYTSIMAMQSLHDSGVKKMARRNKGLVDRTSATIILQGYMLSVQK